MTYSTSLALSRQRYSGRNQNSTSLRPKENTLGPVSNAIVLIVLSCLIGLMYLTQVTKTNAYGYQVNGLQEQQAALINEHDELEVASARLQALERVKNSQPAKDLVAATPSDTIRE